MKFKIMIYVYFVVSLALFLYAVDAFSQRTQVTYTRIMGQFTVIVSDALKDMTQKQLDQLTANVIGLKSEATKETFEESKTEDKEVDGVKLSDKKPNEKLRVIKYDIILKSGMDEKDAKIVGIRNDIATLKQYAIVPQTDEEKEKYQNSSTYHVCNNDPRNSNRVCTISGDF